jgi:hypothetical protein
MTCAILGTLSKCASDFLYAIDHSKTIIFLSKITQEFYFLETNCSFLVPLFGMLSSYIVVGIRSYVSKICNLDEEGIYSLFSI